MKFCCLLSVVLVMCMIATLAPIKLHGQEVQQEGQGFFKDLRVDMTVGFGNYNGNLQRQGLNNPLAPRGLALSMVFSKPIYTIESLGIQAKGRLGADWINYNSPTLQPGQVASYARRTRGGIAHANVQNNAIGVKTGIGLNWNLFRGLYIEPSVDIGIFIHDPRSDLFFDTDGNVVRRPIQVGLPTRYKNTRLRTVSGILPPDEDISLLLRSLNFGMKFGLNLWGNDLFVQYNFVNFVEPWFDGYNDAVGQTPSSNAMNIASAGISFPLINRGSGQPRTIRRPDYTSLSSLTEEEARRIAEDSNGMLVFSGERGVRVNELAAQVEFRNEYIDSGNTLATEMAVLPAGSVTMGYTGVDEMALQSSGNKRVFVFSFMMDVHEVTVLQYRVFLESMGVDLSSDPNILTSRIQDIEGYDTSGKYTWAELLELAELNEFPASYNNPPDLSSVNYLLPDREVWTADGLNNFIPFEDYFFGNDYLDHPVVAVNWYQARLFAAWAGKRLPSESEWEFAAKSGVSGRIYPWDDESVQRNNGTFRANFRQAEGVYDLDGHVVMGPVKSYEPNDFGLYDMAGNVAEWVQDTYRPSYGTLSSGNRLNIVSPVYTNERDFRRVHRGGSWRSSDFFIRSSVRNFMDKHQASTSVGFRLVKTDETSMRGRID